MLSEIATPIDAPALAELVNAAYRGAGGRHGWTHEAELIAGNRAGSTDVATMIGDSSTTVLARHSSKPPTYIGCVAVEMNSADRCTNSMLAVAPELQAAGLGRALPAEVRLDAICAPLCRCGHASAHRQLLPITT